MFFVLAVATGLRGGALGAEHFVNKSGSDANDGAELALQTACDSTTDQGLIRARSRRPPVEETAPARMEARATEGHTGGCKPCPRRPPVHRLDHRL